jgi:hypothetical protein
MLGSKFSTRDRWEGITTFEERRYDLFLHKSLEMTKLWIEEEKHDSLQHDERTTYKYWTTSKQRIKRVEFGLQELWPLPWTEQREMTREDRHAPKKILPLLAPGSSFPMCHSSAPTKKAHAFTPWFEGTVPLGGREAPPRAWMRNIGWGAKEENTKHEHLCTLATHKQCHRPQLRPPYNMQALGQDHQRNLRKKKGIDIGC